MKLGNIDKLKKGPATAVRQNNNLAHTVNYLMRKPVDELVISRRRRAGVGGEAAKDVKWGEVIVAPMWDDPDVFNAEAGINYYILRDISDATADWLVGTTYALNAHVVASDNRKYKSLISSNTGNDPIDDDQANPQYWELSEEIKIERAIGYPTADLRYFIPWFVVGEYVPYISVDEPIVGQTYRIWVAMTYGGPSPYASLRWNQTEQRAMAVFK